MAFDPDAFLAEGGGTAVAEFDPDKFLAEPAPAFDPDAFLSSETAPVAAKPVSSGLQVSDHFGGPPSWNPRNLTLKEAFEEPTIDLPEMETGGSIAHQVVAGIVNPAVQMAEGISSPKGILAGGLLALGGVPAKIVGTVMGAEAVKATPSVVDAILEAKGPYETTAALTNALLNTSMILPAAHGVSRGKGAVLPTDVKGEPRVAPETVLAKEIESDIGELGKLAPEGEATVTGDPFKQPDDFAEYYSANLGKEYDVAIGKLKREMGLTDGEAAFILRDENPREAVGIVLHNRRGGQQPAESEGHRQAYSEMLAQSERLITELQKSLPTTEPLPIKTESVVSEESSPSSVGSHLRTSPTVKSILEERPAPAEQAMKEPSVPAEGGAFGSGGARRPVVKPVGATPRGDTNWLKIPAWYKRAGRGLFTEGARGVLGRTKNEVGAELARATRKHVDIEQELYGQHEKILSDAVKGVPPKRLDAAMAEVERYNRDAENGRTPTPLAADARKILDAWHEVGKSTGDIARANNVQVWDAKLGAHRPMGTVKDYIPRMFSKEVEAALRDPDGNGPMFNSLAQAIATHKGITPEAAAAELNGVAGRFSSNDFHANLEMARSEALPEIFYEYDLGNLAQRYLPAFSERMSQIIAYGQRLGPREAPLRNNLWDVARKESRDQETQQWLNEAEDQATGFKPKTVAGKNARRAQAIGNTALLSDPTTTVVRNLLSGLAVTTERFGIGRAVRELVDAGKSASRIGARELGAIRDDIGQLLNAEQMGESAADNLIRGAQTQALSKSGFSGSETYVRTHNTLVASTFVRDAAAGIASKPTSRLSKEALAHFKRWDIDPEVIVAEKGDWKTGPETRKFIRTAVRESQGGYRFDQVPLWAGTGAGRFLYQYGRWGLQRANDIFKNTISQAIGEKVSFRGKDMTSRNVLPLMRLGLLTVGLGESFAAISSTLFGRDRRDETFSEIGEAWNESELKAVKMLGERMVNDVIMAGTLGLIGQPVDFIKSVKDQSRLKNPTEPPSLFGVKALTTLAQRAQDQGGSLTKRDWMELAGQMTRGPTNVSKVVRSAVGEQSYEAKNDVDTLRAAARRWAKATGQDVALRKGRGDFGKGVNAPTYEPIQDALLAGDAKKAGELAQAFIGKQPNADKARKALKTSVKGRQPFRAGSLSSAENLGEFMEWAEKNLPKDDLAQVKRVQETYVKAATEAGLW